MHSLSLFLSLVHQLDAQLDILRTGDEASRARVAGSMDIKMEAEKRRLEVNQTSHNIHQGENGWIGGMKWTQLPWQKPCHALTCTCRQHIITSFTLPLHFCCPFGVFMAHLSMICILAHDLVVGLLA